MTEFIKPNKKLKYGVIGICKECLEQWWNASTMKEKTKVCSQCKKELPLTYFYVHPNNEDKLKNECKECWEKHSKDFNKEKYSKNTKPSA